MNSENIRGFNDQILIKNDDIDIFHDLSSLEGLRWPDSVISDSFLEGCLPSTSSDQICDSDEAGSYKESEIYLPGNENKDETLVEDDQYYIMVTGLSKEEIFDTLNKCLQLKYQATTTAVVESMDAYPSRADSNIKGGTFRGLTDRLTAPQALKPSELPKPSLGSTAESSEAFALSRPRPSELMYQRQASFRGLGQLSGNTPFKRAGKGHTSLRLNDLPSNRDRVGVSLSDSPILEDMELPPSNLEPDTASVVTKSSQSSKTVDLLTSDEPYCYTSELASILTGSSTPALLGADSCSNYSLSPPPPSLLQPMKLGEREKSENPWDNVPDQPALPAPPAQTSADQWLNSLTSSVTQQNSNIFDFNFDSKFVPSDSKLSVEVQPSSSKSTGTSSGYNSPTSSSSQETWQAEGSKSILEDPFDAEWAAIATRNTNTDGDKPEAASDSQATTNPFITTDSTVKAFELQL